MEECLAIRRARAMVQDAFVKAPPRSGAGAGPFGGRASEMPPGPSERPPITSGSPDAVMPAVMLVASLMHRTPHPCMRRQREANPASRAFKFGQTGVRRGRRHPGHAAPCAPAGSVCEDSRRGGHLTPPFMKSKSKTSEPNDISFIDFPLGTLIKFPCIVDSHGSFLEMPVVTGSSVNCTVIRLSLTPSPKVLARSSGSSFTTDLGSAISLKPTNSGRAIIPLGKGGLGNSLGSSSRPRCSSISLNRASKMRTGS